MSNAATVSATNIAGAEIVTSSLGWWRRATGLAKETPMIRKQL